MYVHCNGKTREEAVNLVCNFDNSDDVREMKRLTHALNAQKKKKYLKMAEKQEQELKKYIDAKEEKLNYLLNLIKISYDYN